MTNERMWGRLASGPGVPRRVATDRAQSVHTHESRRVALRAPPRTRPRPVALVALVTGGDDEMNIFNSLGLFDGKGR